MPETNNSVKLNLTGLRIPTDWRHTMVEDLNSGPPNCKSSALTTRRRCLVDSSTELKEASSFWLPLPSRWYTLRLFATFLANSVRYPTIKVFLPAVRSLHIDLGFPDPLFDCLRLQSARWFIRCSRTSYAFYSDDHVQVIASSTIRPLQFLGCQYLDFCRFYGEQRLTVPNFSSFVPDQHMGISDIATDSELPPPPPTLCTSTHQGLWNRSSSKMLFHSHRHGALLSLCNSGTDAVFVFWMRRCSSSISSCWWYWRPLSPATLTNSLFRRLAFK